MAKRGTELAKSRGDGGRTTRSAGGGLSKSTILIGLVVVAFIVGFGALVWVDSGQRQESEPPEGVEEFDVGPAGKHTQDPVDYEQDPPVGGEHNPVWQNAGFYEEPVIEEKAVHTLEHGAVWITYRADLPENQKEELRRIVESQDCLLASPYPSLSSPVVASAWGKQLRLKSVDDPKLQEFIVAYRKGPQTPESGAPCTGAVEKMNPPPKDDDQ